MKLFTCIDHDCHYPVGVASVIVAESREIAEMKLDAALQARGLRKFIDAPYTLVEQPLTHAYAVVLRDGDY